MSFATLAAVMGQVIMVPIRFFDACLGSFRSSRACLLAAVLASACGGTESATAPSGETGGNGAGIGGGSQTGGSPSSGGNAASGGAATGGVGTGGAATGGLPGTGGASQNTGGTSSTGGNPATGGAATGGVAAAGGAATGGSRATGGAATGGAPPTGGSKATGGAATGGAATGGAATGGAATGGTKATGGAATGGAATGGAATGGAPPTGGTKATGGAATGGAATGGANSTCPDQLLGWATVSGTVTGGGSVTPTTVTTAAQLISAAADTAARVIQISGTITAPEVQVNSNKTIIGVGANATLVGGLRIRGSSSAHVTNVIIKNLHIDGPNVNDGDNNEGDGMQIYYADHVWVDHCDIYDSADGNLDVVHGSHWVTISWTKFRYTSAAPAADHKFCDLIGHSDDNSSEDTGRLGVTLHHNWWSTGVVERMPRVRFGQVHVANNYFNAPGNNYCVRAGVSAHILVEGNYFDGVSNPHEFDSSSSGSNITARNNTYVGTSGSQETGGSGAAFTTTPYSMTIEAASGIPALVQRCAGPR